MRRYLIHILLPCLWTVAPALACPYSIRDAGFIVRDPLPYRLAVVTNRTDLPAMTLSPEQLTAAAEKALDHANVEPYVFDYAKQPPDSPVRSLVDITSFLVGGVLVSPKDRRICLGRAGAEELLRNAVTSPKREEIVKQIIAAWCVVVVVEGADQAQNAAVLKSVSAAAEKLVGFKPEMGDPIRAAPPIVRVAWDDPRERVLRWSLELDEGDPRETRVAVLFGRGRRVGPVMTASQATEGRLLELFRLLGKNCTCTADPSWLLGPALPLNWARDRQQQVREALGFDPNNPNVAATLSGVWKSFRARDSALVPGETVPEPTTGYMEFNVEQEATPPAQQADPDAPRDGNQGAALEQRSWRAAVLAGSAIAAAALGGSAVLYLLNRRRS